jgi:hypothetical protein
MSQIRFDAAKVERLRIRGLELQRELERVNEELEREMAVLHPEWHDVRVLSGVGIVPVDRLGRGSGQ